MNNNEAAARLAELIFNEDDREDLIYAVRDNDVETIDAITDDAEAISLARQLAH